MMIEMDTNSNCSRALCRSRKLRIRDKYAKLLSTLNPRMSLCEVRARIRQVFDEKLEIELGMPLNETLGVIWGLVDSDMDLDTSSETSKHMKCLKRKRAQFEQESKPGHGCDKVNALRSTERTHMVKLNSRLSLQSDRPICLTSS